MGGWWEAAISHHSRITYLGLCCVNVFLFLRLGLNYTLVRTLPWLIDAYTDVSPARQAGAPTHGPGPLTSGQGSLSSGPAIAARDPGPILTSPPTLPAPSAQMQLGRNLACVRGLIYALKECATRLCCAHPRPGHPELTKPSPYPGLTRNPGLPTNHKSVFMSRDLSWPMRGQCVITSSGSGHTRASSLLSAWSWHRL